MTRELLKEITNKNGAKVLTNALRKLGFRCREEFVRSQGYEQETTRRNWMETTLCWLEAIASIDWASFEVIWNELEFKKREWYRKYHAGKLEFPNDLERELRKFNNNIALMMEVAK